MKVTSYTATGTKSTVNLDSSVFEAEVNQVVLSQAIRVYKANARQGSAKTKTRGEVARTKKKWFKQKGTGNARHGARTPSLFVGGGVAFGPNGEQNWTLSLPQKMKHAALIAAFSAQASHVVVHEGIDGLAGKAKAGATLLKQVATADQKVLVVVDQISEVALRSLRNIEQVLVTNARRVTALEVVSADVIVMTPGATESLVARLAGKKTEAVKPAKVAKAKVEKTEKVEKVAAPKKVAKVATKTTKTSTVKKAKKA